MDRRRALLEDYVGFSAGLATVGEAYRSMVCLLEKCNPVRQYIRVEVGVCPYILVTCCLVSKNLEVVLQEIQQTRRFWWYWSGSVKNLGFTHL